MMVSIIANSASIARPLHGVLSVQGHRAAISRGWSAVVDRHERHGEVPEIVVDLSENEEGSDWLHGQRMIDWLWHPAAAGVRRCIALSPLGAGRDDNLLVRSRRDREIDLGSAGIPTTIIRCTHLYEQLGDVIEGQARQGIVHVPDTLFQPVAAFDVARLLATMVGEDPEGASVEIAGPECAPMAYMLQRYMDLSGDTRTVMQGGDAMFLGESIGRNSLVPSMTHQRGHIGLAAWFQRESSFIRTMAN